MFKLRCTPNVVDPDGYIAPRTVDHEVKHGLNMV